MPGKEATDADQSCNQTAVLVPPFAGDRNAL